MEENSSAGSSQDTNGNTAQKAIQLLQEATMLLSSHGPSTEGPSHTTGQPTTSTPSPTASPPSQSAALRQLRTIFSPYTRASLSPASAYQRIQRPKPAHKPYYAVKETWTHEFFCLSEKNQNKVPSRSEKIQLQNCGLGRKKICFSSKANYSKLQEKLFEVYPKLSEAGGFQILRTGAVGNSSLDVIQPPPLGYSVPFLRESSGLGQALAYIRPLQRNLRKSVDQESKNESNENVLQIECIDCKAKIAVQMWDAHQNKCPGGSSSSCSLDTSTMNPQVVSSTSQSVIQATGAPSACHIKELEDLFPMLRKELITKVYNLSCGDLSLAASKLVDLSDDDYNQADDVSILDKGEMLKGDSLESYLTRVVKEGRHQLISVDRNSQTFLADQVKLHKRGLEISKKPDVEFVDEDGVDASGPTKEYFHLTMRTLISGDLRICLFEGKCGHILPLHSTEATESNLFFYAGRMIAHAFLHGGFPFVGKAKAAVTYILTGSIEEGIPQITFEDLPDLFIKNTLSKVMTASKEELEILNASDDVINLLLTSGFVNKLLTMENRQKGVQDILIYYVLKMRIAELDEIRKGMNSVGLATFLKGNPMYIKKAFACLEEVDVVPDDLLKKIKLKSDISNLTTDENNSLCWFKRYITEVPKNAEIDSPYEATLEKLVQFIHGDPLPPTKFMTVKFGKKGMKLPDVDSCPAIIALPISHDNYDDFKKAFDSTLSIQAFGYGRM